MTCLFRYQGLGLDPGITLSPSYAGIGDVGAAHTGHINLSVLDESSHTMSSRTVRTIRAVDAVAGGLCYWDIRPNLWPNDSKPATVTGAYSLRLYYRKSSNDSAQQPVFRFLASGSPTWSLANNQDNRWVVPGVTGQTTALTPYTGMYRVEVQVDPARSPKVVIRIYSEDGTTPLRDRTADPTSVSWDTFRIGHYLTGYYTPALHYADIEIHDDYNLGGQFTSNPASPTAASVSATGAPSSNPTVPARFRWNTSTRRTETPAAPTFTTHSNVTYVTGTEFGRQLDLWVPDGPGPHRCVIWAHSGFGSQGAKTDIPTAWRNDLLERGYAVASIAYVLTDITVGSYPAYGSFLGGRFRGARYPSQILDFKRAAVFLRDNAATYGIDPDGLIASGFSFGGWMALAAAVTRDLAEDEAGTKVSLASAAAAGHAWADSYTGADPEFLGCIVYNAPVDFELSRVWDPTWPNAGGVLQVALRAFQALSQTGTAAPSYPRANVSSLLGLSEAAPPICYVRGDSDYLVHWEHEAALADAIANMTNPADYTLHAEPTNHDRGQDTYDVDRLYAWLDSLPTDPPPPPAGLQLVAAGGTPLTVFTGSTEVTLEVP